VSPGVLKQDMIPASTLNDYEQEANEVLGLEQQETWEIEQERKAWEYEQKTWVIEQRVIQESEQQVAHLHEQQEADKTKKRNLSLQALVGTYISDYGEPRLAILAAIKCATKNITVMMYIFTDKEIATELAKANKAGVAVFVLVDKEQSELKQMTECLTILSNAGVQVCNQNISY
jgi:phosphatidylserine/phosphatidylglycerophosphate/cardiolipin synthase-like enzyme